MTSYYLKFIGPLLLVVLMTTNLPAANFLKGSIYLKNGTVKEGYVKSFSYNQKKIKFRIFHGEKTQVVHSYDIKKIIIVLKEDTLTFANYTLSKLKKKKAANISKTCWAVEVYSSDAIKAYQYFPDPFQYNILMVGLVPIPLRSENNDIYYALSFPDTDTLFKLERTRKEFGEVTSYKIIKKARNILAVQCPKIIELVDIKSQNRLLTDLLNEYSAHCK